MDEKEMIGKMRAGDAGGLEELIARYERYVSTVVWNVFRNAMPPEDGEEVVADVFYAAWTHSGALEPGHVKGWLAAVGRNRAKNKLRERSGALPLEEDSLELPGPDGPDERLQREEEAERVRRAVDALPPEDRDLFLRHYYYLQPVKAIARDTGLNEATIRTRLRRGRVKLKKFLTEEGTFCEA